MSAMENRDEVLLLLERFTRLKQKEIPRELEDYLSFVARTGDTVYPWPAVKYFFRTKLSIVIMDFHDNTPSIADLPQCPNVDPFYYDRMKQNLLSRMDSFNSAPFTIQRICELLNEPRKHYTRIDKFMRAVEKNILVVSTQEPGRRRSDSENGDSLDSIVNGDLEVNVDIEMDNEAFGIDSNEIVPNAASAETEAVIPASACAEEVPPMESSEGRDQDTEKHKSEIVPEVPLTGDGVEAGKPNEVRIVDALPKEITKSEGDVSGTDEQGSASAEKDLYTDDVEPSSPDASTLASKEESLFNAADSVPVSDVHDSNEDTVQKSHDTIEPSATESPLGAVAPSTENDSIDDGEPKAKMAKLSQQVVPESETADLEPTNTPTEKLSTDKDTLSSESTVDSNGSSAEYVEGNSTPKERTETSVLSSSEEPIVSNVDISSDGTPETETILPSSETTLSTCDSVLKETSSAEKEEQIELDQPAKPTTPDELQPTEHHTSETPSESSASAEPTVHITEENGETIVQRTNLEEITSSTNESDQPTASRVNLDDMETLSSTVVSENVMATDEEEQPQQGTADLVVPMAADASELAKSDENAMDIDESSVEPMDQ